jgi:hypothetical protein
MAFTYMLEHEDGTPADPPVLHTAEPNWSVGDTIPLNCWRDSSRDRDAVRGRRSGASRRVRLAHETPQFSAKDLLEA